MFIYTVSKTKDKIRLNISYTGNFHVINTNQCKNILKFIVESNKGIENTQYKICAWTGSIILVLFSVLTD